MFCFFNKHVRKAVKQRYIHIQHEKNNGHVGKMVLGQDPDRKAEGLLV